jgi:tRNA threonylcarbamoyladenosine biosynthesis protein TsaE
VDAKALTPPLASHGKLAMTEAELTAWGERLGRVIDPPMFVTISGDLGAGKTTLARAICRGYGVTEDVTSPTFALVHQYHASRSAVYHLDLYRLDRADELTNIGWDDVLTARALVIVEWPEHAGDRLPRDHVPIRLEHLPDDNTRRLLYAGGDIAFRSSLETRP